MRGVEIWVKVGVVLQDFNWPPRCLPLTFERGEVWITVFQPRTQKRLARFNRFIPKQLRLTRLIPIRNKRKFMHFMKLKLEDPRS